MFGALMKRNLGLIISGVWGRSDGGEAKKTKGKRRLKFPRASMRTVLVGSRGPSRWRDRGAGKKRGDGQIQSEESTRAVNAAEFLVRERINVENPLSVVGFSRSDLQADFLPLRNMCMIVDVAFGGLLSRGNGEKDFGAQKAGW